MTATTTTTRVRSALVLAMGALLAATPSCTLAKDILGEPAKEDALDGYNTYLNGAGTNTEMDFGADQEDMLARYTNLQGENRKLRDTLEKKDQEINTLRADLTSANGRLDRESMERGQAQATSDQVRKQLRALESQVLTLSIEKAEMDMQLTQLRIAHLKSMLNGGAMPSAVEASTPAAPPLGRGKL